MPTTIKKPNRRTGRLSKILGSEIPKEFLFIDTESFIKRIDDDTVEWPLRLGCAIYIRLGKTLEVEKRIRTVFYTVDDFIETIRGYLKRNITLHIIGHNIKFDIMVMNLPMKFGEIEWYNDYPVINDRLFIWRVKAEKSRLLFIDSANFGVISVAQLGKDLGYPKQSVDFDNATDDEMIKYCFIDTEIVEKFILDYLRFIKDNQLGSFNVSLASQALSAWRARFMKKTYYIHNHDMVLQLERDAYHGGRVECFQTGYLTNGPYYYLDVNSMYPFIMSTAKVPTKLLMFALDYTVEKLFYALKQYYCIADVLLDTRNIAYPLLKDGKLIFPIGEYRTTLHDKELQYAIEHGDIKHVYACGFYEFNIIFKEYVEFFRDLRLQAKDSGNLSWIYISKLFGNSLYGKTGQTGITQHITPGPHQQIIHRTFSNIIGTSEYWNEVNWFGTKIVEKRQGEASYSSPAVAGAITSYARMLLYGYAEQAGLENVFYCDTDSLIVNDFGYRKLSNHLDDREIGKLKVESESEIILINGPKDYQFGTMDKHKGVPNSATEIIRGKWRYLQFPGLTGWINKGGNLPPRGRYIEKSRISNYTKGLVEPITGIVTPIVLGQEPQPYIAPDSDY